MAKLGTRWRAKCKLVGYWMHVFTCKQLVRSLLWMWQTARHDVRELDAAVRKEQRAENKEWFLKVSQGNAGGLHRGPRW